jgi:O-antigen ligase/polysaccharide polymerase Wzy-like membrane protein
VLLRPFLHHRLLISVLVVSTVIGLACAKLNASGNLQVAAAATHVMIDEPDVSILLRRALPQDVSSLQKRSEFYARLLVTRPVLDVVAERAGIAPDELSGVARTTAEVPIPLTEPGSEERASQIRDAHAPYRLELQSHPDEPVLAVYAQAPSEDEALRLADSAVLGLQDYITDLGADQRITEAELPQLRQLGAARGGVINRRAPIVIIALTFMTAFAITFSLLWGGIMLRRRARGEEPEPEPPSRLTGKAAADWPHTTRLLPWAIAAFIVMVWLTPFDKIQLAFHTPIDMKLDRLTLPFLAAIWLLAFAAGPGAAPRLRFTRVHFALAAFLACAFLSVVVEARYLNQTGEFDAAFKRLPLLVSYLSVFVIVASSIRLSEVRAYMTLTLALAVVCGIGIVWEFRFNQNLFSIWSDRLLPPIFAFVSDGNGSGLDSLGRRWIAGPAGYGVEAVGMLAMALPIAVVRMLNTPERRRRAMYGAAIAVLLAGIFATGRKSALLAPAAVMLTLGYFRRRELLSLAPFGLVIVFAVTAVSPGAVHSVVAQFTRSDAGSVATVSDRAADYDAVRPDMWTHLLFGRGFGTYNHQTYRILDSEVLSRVVETGLVGLAAFLLMLLSVVLAARKIASGRDPLRAPVALCGVAAAVCFLVISTLYDAWAYPHGTYVFLYIAGLVVVVTAGRRAEPPGESPQSDHEPSVREPPWRPFDVFEEGPRRAPDVEVPAGGGR